jgi:hypothetical protein
MAGSMGIITLNIESRSGNTNDSICILFHIQKTNDMINICEPLLASILRWLSEQCRELQSLSYSGCIQMYVLLHAVAGLSLERLVSLTAVHKHVTTNDAHGRSTRENIEECSLTCT